MTRSFQGYARFIVPLLSWLASFMAPLLSWLARFMAPRSAFHASLVPCLARSMARSFHGSAVERNARGGSATIEPQASHVMMRQGPSLRDSAS